MKHVYLTAAGPSCVKCGHGVDCWLAADESPCKCPNLTLARAELNRDDLDRQIRQLGRMLADKQIEYNQCVAYLKKLEAQ